MGLFDFVDKKINETNRSSSSINPGRMKETDNIKGPNSNLPNSPGMYRHVNKEDGKIEYVGQTKDLRTRQQQHARDGKLNTDKQYVQYSEARAGASKSDLCRTEVDHIARHKPSGNTTKGGNGRR